MTGFDLLHKALAHPLTRGMDIDDPRTTEVRLRIIQQKPFLHRLYKEWYSYIAGALPAGPGAVLELGSGAGFLNQYVPGLITSEVFQCSNVRIVLDAHQLPFHDSALRSIVMTDVLHHLPRPRKVFAEATRCLRPGGMVVMVEPWPSLWSAPIFKWLHHEPFQPDAMTWEFPESGPLSGANQAMPWMIFQRDRSQFEKEFPLLRIRSITPMMPFRYLISGGVSMRAMTPGWSFPLWRAIETAVAPARNILSMFARIELVRQ